MKYFLLLIFCSGFGLFHSSIGQADIPVPAERIDCHPDPFPTETRCLSRGCVWSPIQNPPDGAPFCFTPKEYGYRMVGEPQELPDGYRVALKRYSVNSSYFGGDFENLTLRIEFQSNYRLRIKITPTDVQRFEVPLKINPPASPATNPLYRVLFRNSPTFSFRVERISSGVTVFDTSLGGLTFSDQFIQLSTRLPSKAVYGIGENEQTEFLEDFNIYGTIGVYARDAYPNGDSNVYGVQPYYTVVENSNGDTHSVMIINSNAQEFSRTPAPAFIYRTIGGVLDIYIFFGPTPEKTVEQFTEAVGRHHIPPYWGLGFQLCRWGYDTLENMKAAVNRTAFYGIPQDVQYGDIDIMERTLDFTYDKVNFAGLPEYIKELKDKGIKFVTILDPAISFNEPAGTYKAFELGNEMDVWIKRPDGTPFVGQIFPGLTYFPDYSRNSTREWWISLVSEFHDLLNYDGLWIDMNEPANMGAGDLERGGCDQNNLNYPPYIPHITNRSLFEKTICPDALQDFGRHYDTHSLFGWSESEPTLAGVRKALGKRGLVLTRSSFIGNGQWASHWLGDNDSHWSNLLYSIIGMLQFNQFGIPYVGADICGYAGEAELEMCLRWTQLGAFYPFARNHNRRNTTDQDPGNFGPEFAESAKKALFVRYTLLPHFYTLFYKHRVQGSTVVRALWHEFTTDGETLSIDRQFLWGSGVLVSPVLDEGATTVNAYFPDARWYSYYDGAEVSARRQYVTLPAPLDFINVHLRGGIIYPTQEPAVNTELSRNNPFGLIICLDNLGQAKGDLYIDDGESIEPQDTGLYFETRFIVGAGTLTNAVVGEGYDVSTKVMDSIRIMGPGSVAQVFVNGLQHYNFTQKPSGEVHVTGLNLPLNDTFLIQWS